MEKQGKKDYAAGLHSFSYLIETRIHVFHKMHYGRFSHIWLHKTSGGYTGWFLKTFPPPHTHSISLFYINSVKSEVTGLEFNGAICTQRFCFLCCKMVFILLINAIK